MREPHQCSVATVDPNAVTIGYINNKLAPCNISNRSPWLQADCELKDLTCEHVIVESRHVNSCRFQEKTKKKTLKYRLDIIEKKLRASLLIYFFIFN